MIVEFKVIDVACVDDSSRTRGVIINCDPFTHVTLIFEDDIQHEQTDELRDLLRRMKLSRVLIQGR